MDHQPNLEENQLILQLEKRIDLFKGCLYGAVLGDAIGKGLQSVDYDNKSEKSNTHQQIVECINLNRKGKYYTHPHQISDESEVMLRLSLQLQHCMKTAEINLNDIAKAYFQWFQTQPNDIGIALHHALNFAYSATDDQKADKMREGSNQHDIITNDSLIRACPLAIFLHQYSEEIIDFVVRNEVSLTHSSQIAQNACVSYCVLIQYIIESMGDRKSAFENFKCFTLAMEDEDLKEWVSIAEGPEIYHSNVPHDLQTSYIYAIHFFKENYSYLDAIYQILQKGGETDANCFIVGGILGVADGYNSLPPELIEILINFDQQVAEINQLERRPDYCHITTVEIFLETYINQFYQNPTAFSLLEERLKKEIDEVKEKQASFVNKLKESLNLSRRFNLEINRDVQSDLLNDSKEQNFNIVHNPPALLNSTTNSYVITPRSNYSKDQITPRKADGKVPSPQSNSQEIKENQEDSQIEHNSSANSSPNFNRPSNNGSQQDNSITKPDLRQSQAELEKFRQSNRESFKTPDEKGQNNYLITENMTTGDTRQINPLSAFKTNSTNPGGETSGPREKTPPLKSNTKNVFTASTSNFHQSPQKNDRPDFKVEFIENFSGNGFLSPSQSRFSRFTLPENMSHLFQQIAKEFPINPIHKKCNPNNAKEEIMVFQCKNLKQIIKLVETKETEERFQKNLNHSPSLAQNFSISPEVRGNRFMLMNPSTSNLQSNVAVPFQTSMSPPQIAPPTFIQSRSNSPAFQIMGGGNTISQPIFVPTPFNSDFNRLSPTGRVLSPFQNRFDQRLSPTRLRLGHTPPPLPQILGSPPPIFRCVSPPQRQFSPPKLSNSNSTPMILNKNFPTQNQNQTPKRFILENAVVNGFFQPRMVQIN